MTRLRGLFVVVSVAAALSGCGSDDEKASSSTTTSGATTTSGDISSLQGWAEGLCMSVSEWQQSVQGASAEMSKSQTNFASASQAISSAADGLVESLKGIGTPPAPATTAANDAIEKLSAELEEQAGDIEASLEKPPSTQSQVETASSQVRTSIKKMNSDISETVTTLKALPDEQGWKQAFQQVAACHSVAKT